MKLLKRKSLKSLILPILLLLGFGIFFLCKGVPALLVYINGPADMDTLDYDSDDLNGTYVSGTLYQIYDYYCEETKKTELYSREYIIDAGPDYYMGFYVRAKDTDRADALMEATQQYYDGEADEDTVVQLQYQVTGTIRTMPDDSQRYYRQYLVMDSMDEEERAIFLTYYLVENAIGDTTISGMIADLVFGIGLLAAAAVIVILICTGRFQKQVNAYIASSSNSMSAREKVDYFLNNTKPVRGLTYNRDFICGQSGSTTAFGETGKLVWAYQQTTTHKRYFITVGTTYSLILIFTDGKRQTVSLKKKGDAEELLNTLSQLCPKAIIGYDKELDQMYRKNFSGFLQLKYNKPLTQQASFGEDDSETHGEHD